MGADEEFQAQPEAISTSLGERVEEKLDHGWRISSLPGGQLLLIPPPTYGEPPKAA